MRRIALDLDRPSVDVAHQDAVGIATDDAGGGEQVTGRGSEEAVFGLQMPCRNAGP